jgi:hypothetical protein
MAGEDAHDLGETGLQRAKQWLELSTRVDKCWTRHDRPSGELLEFQWPHAPNGGSSARFSFDLGGTFRGGHLENESFVAEVKAYRKENDLPTHFRDFLAKCYVALESHPGRCDHFLWVSWAPFQAQQWDRHATAESVRRSVLHAANRARTLGLSDEGDAAVKLSSDLLVGVADRMWLVTLSEKQEKLVLSTGHYVEVVKMITSERRVVA